MSTAAARPSTSTSQVPFLTPASLPSAINRLASWLSSSQAISVPDGWVEACVEWLVSEHGGVESLEQQKLGESQWRQLVYEQWLHADLQQLDCPVLPPQSMPPATAVSSVNRPRDQRQQQRPVSVSMRLEGELCLQVVDLFISSDSYYGQLRRAEGNLSSDLPDLEDEFHGDTSSIGVSQYGSSSFVGSQASSASRRQHYGANQSRSLCLVLTDGLRQVNAVELGSCVNRRNVAFDQLASRLKPGTKVRLRGPLTLRSNVVMLPAGSIESLVDSNDNANSGGGGGQLQVLGGEVDELLTNSSNQPLHQLALRLADKLNLDLTNTSDRPSWFPTQLVPLNNTNGEPFTGIADTLPPSVVSAPSVSSSSSWATPSTSADPTPPLPQSVVSGQAVNSRPTPSTVTRGDPLSQHIDPLSSSAWPSASVLGGADNETRDEDLFEDDESWLLQSAQSMDSNERRSATVPSNTSNQLVQSVYNDNDDDSFEYDVDPDVLASAFDQIDDGPVPPAPRPTTLSTDFSTNKMTGLQSTRPIGPITNSSLYRQPRPSASSAIRPSFTINRSASVGPYRSSFGPYSTSWRLNRPTTSTNSGLKQSSLDACFKSTPTPSTTGASHPVNVPTNPGEDSVEKDPPPLLPPSNLSTSWQAKRLRLSTALADAASEAASTSHDHDFTRFPFIYIQDMYSDLVAKQPRRSISTNTSKSIFTIRGLLVSLISSLDQDQGRRWSLAGRLADGSATVDVDISDQLLTEWIGMSASESETLRRLSRVDASSSSVIALQQAQTHRQRLRSALSSLQQRLTNLAGLFVLTLPKPTTLVDLDAANQPQRPVLVAFRKLDSEWLSQLARRVDAGRIAAGSCD